MHRWHKWILVKVGLEVLKSLAMNIYFGLNLGRAVCECTLQWRHNERDDVSNHRCIDCLLNRFFQAQIKANLTDPRHWPLWGESTGDQWIPLTNGQ